MPSDARCATCPAKVPAADLPGERRRKAKLAGWRVEQVARADGSGDEEAFTCPKCRKGKKP